MSQDFVVLSDSFKGSLSSADAGEAMARGIRRAWQSLFPTAPVSILTLPVGDGGEGSAHAFTLAKHGILHTLDVVDCTGAPCSVSFGALDAHTAVFDVASVCGFSIVRARHADTQTVSTWGVGLVLKKLAALGYRHVYVCLGGSGTTDGGIGALAALGARFTDSSGQALQRFGGISLQRIAHMDLTAASKALAGMRLTLLYDVAVPLTGPSGAALQFSPQKGASSKVAHLLEDGMRHYARLAAKTIAARGSGSLAHTPGCGAAGGLGFGLLLVGGQLLPGAKTILEACEVPTLLHDARAVFTGEGKTDAQTARGKLPFAVAGMAKTAGIPCIDICAVAEPSPSLYTGGMTAVFSFLHGCMSKPQSIAHAPALLESTAFQATRLLLFSSIQQSKHRDAPPIP